MRRIFIFVALVLVVGLIVVAFYRHWMEISVSSPQEGQARLALTLDRNQFQDDFAGFTGSGKAHSAPAEKTVHGKLLSVDAGQHRLFVLVDNADPIAVDVPAGVKVSLGQRDGTLADLQPGMMLSITCVMRDGQNTAQAVTVETQ
jgi:hypothetical protein